MRVRCAFCENFADEFFLTFSKALWAVCEGHTFPLEKIAIKLDPEEYDLEGYFQEFYEEEPPDQ